MTLRVTLTDEGFVAALTRPDGASLLIGPMTATELLQRLGEMGCHSTDATDALDASGADWRPEHDAEVLRRRR